MLVIGLLGMLLQAQVTDTTYHDAPGPLFLPLVPFILISLYQCMVITPSLELCTSCAAGCLTGTFSAAE